MTPGLEPRPIDYEWMYKLFICILMAVFHESVPSDVPHIMITDERDSFTRYGSASEYALQLFAGLCMFFRTHSFKVHHFPLHCRQVPDLFDREQIPFR